MLKRTLFLLFILTHAASHSENRPDYIGLYSDLLQFHTTQPTRLAIMKINPYEKVPREVLERLNPEVLKAHILKYVKEYMTDLKRQKETQEELIKMKRKLADLPLMDPLRPDLELAIRSKEKIIEELPGSMFMLSMNANADLVQSLKTLPVDKRTVSAKAESKPKMPGTFGGSFDERMKQDQDEKILLTPVDDEFYETQLGKKIERDFGGRAQYWSYNYEADELYVRVKGDTSRITVIKDQGGVRFIKTRSGSDFTVIRGPDEKVDMLKAKGRFLTGDKDDDSLFGDMPKKSGPAVIDERKLLPPGHSHGDGHNH